MRRKHVLLAGILSILVLAFVGCNNPTGSGSGNGTTNGSGSGVNRTALQDAIGEAQSLLNATDQSADGNDVHTDRFWTDATQRTAFQTAISNAHAVLANNAATQAQVDAAVTALNSAANAFTTARQSGTLPPGQISLAGLNTAIATATALRDSTVAATDGFAVQAGLWWATSITRETFVNAITAAETAQTNSTTQADINLATQILNAAITTFNSARSLSEPGDIRIRGGHELILRGRVYYQGTNNVFSGVREVFWFHSTGELPGQGAIDADGFLLFRIASPPTNVLLTFPEFVEKMWGGGNVGLCQRQPP